MAGYHQHYLNSSFDQPRVLSACETSADDGHADVIFQFSHRIDFNFETQAKGFTACCENDYGKYLFLMTFLNHFVQLNPET